ncbi:MAG: MopE-related protein [Pseudomonadota bacterium]
MVRTFLALCMVAALAACGTTDDPGGSIDVSGEWDSGADAGDAVEGDTPPADVAPPPEDTPKPPPDTPAEDVPQAKLPGGPCEDDIDCEDGPCVPTPDGYQCSVPCTEDCGVDGWICFPKTGMYFPGLCLQPAWILCRPCVTDDDCEDPWSGEAATCIDAPGGMGFCARACQTDDDCPDPYDCKQAIAQGIPTPTKMCTWGAGPCPCLDLHLGAKTTCKATSEAGVCTGTATCVEGALDCDASMPVFETCNNKDDNCNGATDEELGVQTCGKGVCEHETPACQNGQVPYCNPTQGASAELCDGLDNNCNGETDDLWPNLGQPCDGPDPDLCESGIWECSPENVLDVVCVGDGETGAEVCDGVDNNCNGQTDEGLGSTTCGLGLCYHSVQNCVAGVPQVCDPMQGAVAGDLPDPASQDANCDGIDGVPGDAIFVDTESGNDGTADGSMAAPYQTLAAAIQAAVDAGKGQVYVGEGSYLEDLDLVSGVSLYGGYEPGQGWTRNLNFTTTVGAGTTPVSCDGQTGIEVQGFLFQSGSDLAPGASVRAGFLHDCEVLFSHCTFQTGDAGDGLPGADGANGQPGQDGGGGQNSCQFGGWGCGETCPQPQGGGAGGSPCSQTGGPGAGGGEDNKVGNQGSPGANGGGNGGTAGAVEGNGGNGGNGANGANGTDGATAAWGGAIDAAGYTPGDGADGTNGTHGKGGGGGGSGGGDNTNWECPVWGAGGGGGGGGGCRGSQGTRGTGGGGSFGLYAVDSTLTLESSVVFAGNGGDGGAGGDGGNGANGGGGGNRGQNGIQDEGQGGNGGKGGNGGDGGAGSGGDGGPSVGIVCVGAVTLTVDNQSLVSPGFQGAAGPAASGGSPGHAGFTAVTHGCE